MNLNNSKKANLGFVKIIGLVLLVLVIIFVMPKNLGKITSSGLSDAKLQVAIAECDLGNCNILNCDLLENSGCSDKEKSDWLALKTYQNNCENKDGTPCSNSLIDAIKVSKNNLDNSNNIDISVLNLRVEQNIEKIKKLGGGIFKIDLKNINYNLEKNYDKMDSRLKITYNRLKKLKISTGIFSSTTALDLLILESKNKGLNPLLTLVVINQESNGDPNIISNTGCLGLMQFCSGTAKEFTDIFNSNKIYSNCKKSNKCSVDDRINPEKSIKAGVLYLFQLSHRYNDNILLILASYNAGTLTKCKNLKTIEEVATCISEKPNTISKKVEVTDYVYKISNNYKTMLS